MYGPPKDRQEYNFGTAGNMSAARGSGHLSNTALQEFARQHAPKYSSADPYKHIVIDNLVPDALARACMQELQAKHNLPAAAGTREATNEATKDTFWFTRTTPMGAKRGRGGYPTNTQAEAFGPSTVKLFDFFQSRRFIAFLETLTGIRNLTADSAMFGGGPFSIVNGGFLSLHTDFNKHQNCSNRRGEGSYGLRLQPSPGCRVVTPGWRRLNLLMYLNEDWREEWGGSFELWRTDQHYSFLEYSKKVLPELNRIAIFSVTDVSIHGHLDPVNHPNGEARKSLSFYYYTPTIDDEPLITPLLHESIYMPGHAATRSVDRWRTRVPKYVVR